MFNRIKTRRKRFKVSKKRAIQGVITGLICAMATMAVASWLTDSTGNGRGKVGSLQSLTVSAGPAPSDALFTGGPAGSASVHVDNPNSAPLEVYEVTDPGTGFTIEGTDLVNTQKDAVKALLSMQPHVLASPITVQPGGSDITIPATFKLASGAPDYAQGQTFTKGITLRARTLN